MCNETLFGKVNNNIRWITKPGHNDSSVGTRNKLFLDRWSWESICGQRVAKLVKSRSSGNIKMYNNTLGKIKESLWVIFITVALFISVLIPFFLKRKKFVSKKINSMLNFLSKYIFFRSIFFHQRYSHKFSSSFNPLVQFFFFFLNIKSSQISTANIDFPVKSVLKSGLT